MKNIIKPEDWAITGMPDTYAEAYVDRHLSEIEYHALIQGFSPRDMDDRWLMYLKDDWLYLHRSWTGFCIFKVKLQSIGNEFRLTNLQINRNYTQYKSTNIEADKNELNSVLNTLIAMNINK
jgi:hypothetical protein